MHLPVSWAVSFSRGRENAGESVPELITEDSFDLKEFTLTASERLVRDGAAKLFLCWTAWTLAQHHQTTVKITGLTPLRDSIGKNALGIIQQTCKGRGVGVARQQGGDGIRNILDKAKFTAFANGKTVTSFDALAKELVPAVVSCKSSSAIASVGWLTLPTWRDVQDFAATQAKLHDRRDSRVLADHGAAHESAARMFWGSGGSLERTTVHDLAAGHHLTTYLQEPAAGGIAASPIPVRLLEHWASILGFYDTDHPVANAVLTAFSDPTASPTRLVGSSLEDFAKKLGEWLSDSRTIKVPADRKALVSASARQRAQTAALVPPGTPDAPPSAVPQPPVGARPVVRVNQHPTDPDSIRLSAVCSGNHLVLKDVDFVIDSAEPEAEYRVCLRSLDVVLTWPETKETAVTDGHHSWSGGDGDDVKIVKRIPEGRSMSFRVARRDGKLLSPREAIAFNRFTLPAFSHDDDLQLKVALHACGAQAAIGKRSDDDQFFSHKSSEEDVTMAEAAKRLLEELRATIEGGFPRQPTVPKELGFRIVDLKRNDR